MLGIKERAFGPLCNLSLETLSWLLDSSAGVEQLHDTKTRASARTGEVATTGGSCPPGAGLHRGTR